MAGVVAAMQVGKLPPALPELSQTLGLSLVQGGFLLSLVQAAGMLLGLAVGLMCDALGLRRAMLAGLLLLAVASTAGAFASSAAVLLSLRALEGLGLLWVALPAPALIRRLVAPERVSLRLGLWGMFMPLGTAASLLLTPALMALAGWRSAWWVLGLLSLGMALWLRHAVPKDKPRAPGAPATAAPWWPRLRLTLGSRGPWWVALTFALYSGQWLAVIGFLPTLYAQAGVAAFAASALTALAALVNAAGNFASGRAMHRGVPPQRLLWLGFAAMALGAGLVFGLGPQWPAAVRYGAVLVFSGVGGLVPAALFALAVRLAPDEGTVATTVGWVQQCSALGQFAGPPLVAALASQAGHWGHTGWATGLACALGMALAASLPRRP